MCPHLMKASLRPGCVNTWDDIYQQWARVVRQVRRSDCRITLTSRSCTQPAHTSGTAKLVHRAAAVRPPGPTVTQRGQVRTADG